MFSYGSDGLRHRSAVNGVTTDFALDGQSVVREMRAGVNYATYLSGPTGPMYRRSDGDGTVRWYVYDGLGSVVGEVDPNGVMTARRGFDVYGATRSSTGTPTSKHGFVGGLGHTTEDETGLVYMRARYYDAGVGRFVSEDPAKSGGNWFEYCYNSPTNLWDASGKSASSVLTGLMIAVGLAAGTALGYALMVLILEKAHKGYEGGKAIPQALLTFGAAMLASLIGLFANPSDVAQGEENVGEIANEAEQEIARSASGWGRIAGIAGIAFVVGIMIGVAQALVEYYSSSYYQDGA